MVSTIGRSDGILLKCLCILCSPCALAILALCGWVFLNVLSSNSPLLLGCLRYRKNKAPERTMLFRNTYWHVNITIILLIYLILIMIPSTWTSSISAKLEITQLFLIKQITGTFYFSRKHIWLKHVDHP